MGPSSNRPGGAGGRSRDSEPDASLRQAFEQAVHHAQLALSEGVASARALLDAASIGVTGGPARDHPRLAEFAWTLDRIAAALSGEAPSLRAAALSALLAAIDREVVRWEARSRSDADARAVLRVFLGLREILWEIGVRPSETKPEQEFTGSHAQQGSRRANADRTNARPKGTKEPGTARVQRITIRG